MSKQPEFEGKLAAVAWEALAHGWEVSRDEEGALFLELPNGEIANCWAVAHPPASSNPILGIGCRESGSVVVTSVPVVDMVEASYELIREVNLWSIGRTVPVGAGQVVPIAPPGKEGKLARITVEHRISGVGFRPEEVIAAICDIVAEVEGLRETLWDDFGAESADLDHGALYNVPLTLGEGDGERVTEPVGRACQLSLFGSAGRQYGEDDEVPRPLHGMYMWAMSQARRLGLSEPTPLLLARACAQRDHQAFRLQFGPRSVERILNMPVDELSEGSEGEVRHVLNRAVNNQEIGRKLIPFVVSELSRALPELVDPAGGKQERGDSALLEEARRIAHAFEGPGRKKKEEAKRSAKPVDVPARKEIERGLKLRVKGQDDVASKVSARLSMAFRGLAGPSTRPKGVFLFAGPTGVGKTEMAKAIADTIYGPGDNLIRLDMSEFRERHSTARLIGPPPGYVGHTDPDGWLTTKMISNPNRVLLLDEFEKADEAVWQTFLQVFEDGRLTDGRGRTADFSQAVVVLTSNLGSRSVAAKPTGFGQALGAEETDAARNVIAAVRRDLPPELFNRLDGVFAFAPLSEKLLVEIVRAKLAAVKIELAEAGYELTFTPAVARAIAAFEPDPTLGARPALRAVDRLIREPLVDLEPGSYRVRSRGGEVLVGPLNCSGQATSHGASLAGTRGPGG